MAAPRKPGDLFKAFQAKKMKASGPVKMSGSFQGKSNTLGHGGRAAQLKARGVPGGVIGALARRAQAAPGQKNFHGKKKKAAGVIGSPMKSLTNTPVKNPSWIGQGAASSSRTLPRTGSVSRVQSGPWANLTLNKKKRKGGSKKRKSSSTTAPINRGRAAQAAYANKFGTVPVSKKKGSVKKKGAMMPTLQNSVPLRGVTPGVQRIAPTNAIPGRFMSGTRMAKGRVKKKSQ